MSYNLNHHPGKSAQMRLLLTAALVLLAWALVAVTKASAQNVTPPTPASVTPPAGNSLFLKTRAAGTQGYVCLPASTRVSWTVNGSRPEATLFAGEPGRETQIITHFLSPDTNPNELAPKPLPVGSATWQSSADSSKVWGQTLRAIPAGSDVSCPNRGAIPCLLLQSIGSKAGPTGGNTMVLTTFIQRLNTDGGSAPAAGCSTSSDVGRQALVPYAADYYFFRADQ